MRRREAIARPSAEKAIDQIYLDESEQVSVVAASRRAARTAARKTAAVFALALSLAALLYAWLAAEQALRPFELRHTGELRTVLIGQGRGGGEGGGGSRVPFALVQAAQAAALAASAAAVLGAGARFGGALDPEEVAEETEGSRRRRTGRAAPSRQEGELDREEREEEDDAAAAGRWRRFRGLARRDRALRLAAAAGVLLGAAYWFLAMRQHGKLHPRLPSLPWELVCIPVVPVALAAFAEIARRDLAATAADVAALDGMRYAHKRV
jgi:hypothetical protein